LNGAGSLSAGTTSGVSDGSGNVTFTGLTITGTAGTKSLTFSSGALPTVNSANIALGAGAATQVAITTQPGGGANGAALSPQPVVQIQDAQGNPLDTTVTVTATIATSPGGSPSLANATAGTSGGNSATFSGLAITGLAGGYTLTFSAAPLTAATSGPLTLTAGPVDTVAFQTPPPVSGASGAALASTVLRVVDDRGNPVGGVTVTASIVEAGATVRTGTETATSDGSGLATFSGLIVDGTAAGYTLQFSANSRTVSQAFTLGVGTATQLAIATEPSVTATSGIAFSQQPVIQLRDSGGNDVTTAGIGITAEIASGSGTIGGTTGATTAGDGKATFTDLSITGSGAHTIRFRATGLTAAISVQITVNP
jgi:hypothetical protein